MNEKFTELELKILREEIGMRIDDWSDYLEDNDSDEESRDRMLLLELLWSNLEQIVVDIDKSVEHFHDNYTSDRK